MIMKIFTRQLTRKNISLEKYRHIYGLLILSQKITLELIWLWHILNISLFPAIRKKITVSDLLVDFTSLFLSDVLVLHC